MNKSVKKKEKLDPTHVFLQFLMVFLTLCFLIGTSYFIQDFIWPNNFEMVVSLLSGELSIIIASLFLYRSTLKKEKKGRFFALGVFFFLLGILVIIGVRLGILSVAGKILSEPLLIFILLTFLLFLIFKRGWEYDNLTFWGIFSISLFIFARLFFVRSLLFSDVKLVEFSIVVDFFAYVAILIGAVNEIYETLKVTKGAKKSKKK